MLKSWAKNYSIFLRKICFGKEDGFFLPLPRVFPATSAVFLGLLTFISSTGLAKGEISLISIGGGDQELPFPVFLLTFVFTVLLLFGFCSMISTGLGLLSNSPRSLEALDVLFCLVLKAGGETTNREDISDTNSFSWAAASMFLAKDKWETNKTLTCNCLV